MGEEWRARDDDVDAIAAARCGDPFAVLGPHLTRRGLGHPGLRADAISVRALTRDGALLAELPRRKGDFFEALIPSAKERPAYRVEVETASGNVVVHRPLCVRAGARARSTTISCAKARIASSTAGSAPSSSATRASTACCLRSGRPTPRASPWSATSITGTAGAARCASASTAACGRSSCPHLTAGAVYKYELAGPTARCCRSRPILSASRPSSGPRPPRSSPTAPISPGPTPTIWPGAREGEPRRKPMSIYEVHLGSWRRGEDGRFLTYDELADQLIPYAADMGYTHLELLPISEHPLDESWGYQPIGLFAPTRRFGEPAGFARFVDRAHAAGLGVILDWAPAHFPTDAHGLARFDGTALYEHADPRKGFHPDWNTAIYNFGRHEVANFLYCNALYWVDRFHVDGLRVDAVASMLYLDYSRREGEWLPNPDGSRENREAIAFLRRANELVYGGFPGRGHHRRGIDRLSRRLAADRPRRSRLRLQMEHGLDARHARLHVARSDLPPLEPRQDDLRSSLRLQREFRAADLARRGRARQRLGRRQNAGRRMAALRQRPRLLRLHVGPPGQEAPVHGPGVRADQRVERFANRCPGGCSIIGRTRACRR